MGRILAIDYGQKRVGVAVTEPLQIISTALTTVNAPEIWKFLKDYTVKEKVDGIVVGLPKQMNNTPSESMKYIQPFLNKLVKDYPDLPVYVHDERFTSKMAFQTMIDSGLKKKDRQNKALIDTVSATIILQNFMELKESGFPMNQLNKK